LSWETTSTRDPLLRTDGDLVQVLDQLDFTVLVTDRDGVITYVNRALERASGYGAGELLGQTPRLLSGETLPSELYLDIWRGLKLGEPHRSTIPNRKKTGELYLEDTSISPVRDTAGEIGKYVWAGRPAEFASLDSLTGIPSRRRYQEEVDAAISRGETGAVLFMDVDDFKAINDSLGHTAGDEFLRSLALCLSAELRRDDVLARLGGDEFAVLLRGVNRGEATLVAQRMLKSVREMKAVSADQPFASTISIGGALFPMHGTSVDELLGHADMAMYGAKRSGRNGLRFYQPRQGSKASSMSRVVWKQKIIDALAHDRFTLYAQPIFELKTRRLGCYELLLRMREPGGRIVLPDRFIPAAEQSGLIQEIDTWVVRQSLAIAAQLSTAPRPMKTAFNLSATAVSDGALLDLIKREVAANKLDPGFVSIEVTETALISDLPKARVFFRTVKDMGFLIALDDFGAGFSSLSRLKEVPADYLKIAGSFVENIGRTPKDRHFVRAIADLASGLGIGAVAESIEDQETVEILMELGVLNGQGNYLGEPLPISRVLESHLVPVIAA
jgi:diguanylate cyclase (GGDEF)-like protein/PAS domain S-box-containing protein